MAGGRPGESGAPTIPGYSRFETIGRTATSLVVRAWDEELSRWVAIKLLLVDDATDPARLRFKREGAITANLGRHPYIVQVLQTGFTSEGMPYVAMEYFEGGSIADRIATSGIFNPGEVVDIGAKIADAVDAAHRAGVLHRDIKPANILLSEYGPALADFGIARSATNLDWSVSLDHLTPFHAPPEILNGEPPSPQSDIYSLGSTLYTMLAGRPPFAGPPGEGLLRLQVRVRDEPVPTLARADVPAELFGVIVTALAKAPADRFATSAAMGEALLAGAASHVLPSAPANRSPWAPPAPIVQPPEAQPQADSELDGEATAIRRTQPASPPRSNAAAGTPLTASPWQRDAASDPSRPSTTTVPAQEMATAVLGEEGTVVDGELTVARPWSRGGPAVGVDTVESPAPGRTNKAVVTGIVAALVLLAAVGGLLLAGGDRKGTTLTPPTTTQALAPKADWPRFLAAGAIGSKIVLRWANHGNLAVKGQSLFVVRPPAASASPLHAPPLPGASTIVGPYPLNEKLCFLLVQILGAKELVGHASICLRGGRLDVSDVPGRGAG